MDFSVTDCIKNIINFLFFPAIKKWKKENKVLVALQVLGLGNTSELVGKVKPQYFQVIDIYVT